ncbi:hypothetical protein AB5N19_09543 [Seiridium cardinale]
MAGSVSLVALTNGAAKRCSRMADSLTELGASIGKSRATFSSMAAECLITHDVLQRLEAFLAPETQDDESADHQNQEGPRHCFDVLVQPINTTLDEIDAEIRRVRRYSAQQDPVVQSKLIPILQDFLYDARRGLRKNRSSLSMIMDCIDSGILAEAKVELQQASPFSSMEKISDILQSHPRVAILLKRQSSRPQIQQQTARIKPKSSRGFRMGSKGAKKLHEGITKGDYAMVCKALAEKADPNAAFKSSKAIPIHRALSRTEAALGCEDETASRDLILIVVSLILAGANLKVVDENLRTPLIRAVRGEMGDGLVALMLEYGAVVNATDNNRNTALHYAAMQHASAEMKNVETIRTLLAYGADLSIGNKRNRTPLYKAVMWEHMDQAIQLLDYGSNLEIEDSNGWTALYGAVHRGNTPLAKLLCERGAFVEKKDKTGQTPLHYAVSQGRQEIVQVLVAAGADVNLISKGETPLCRATAKSNGPLINYLLSHGADVSVPSPGYNGALPIHIAAIGRDLGVLAALIEAGSFIDAQDGAGRTPLAWAMEAGRDEIVHFLMNKGASLEL